MMMAAVARGSGGGARAVMVAVARVRAVARAVAAVQSAATVMAEYSNQLKRG